MWDDTETTFDSQCHFSLRPDSSSELQGFRADLNFNSWSFLRWDCMKTGNDQHRQINVVFPEMSLCSDIVNTFHYIFCLC